MIRVRRHVHRLSATIPTASMADIAFLLIIFFLVTTVFSTDQTVVDLPASVNREEIVRNSALLTVTAEGVIKATDGEVSQTIENVDQLDRFIAEVLRQNPARSFVVKGDRRAAYRYIEFCLERLRLSRARNVYFLTEARGPRRQG
ncbi:MAG TPA: biopolymer transporter ExbD [Blastocatellia bacterium]|nr:biopolymer transporter ExbD [Blastocatellia bacterium]